MSEMVLITGGLGYVGGRIAKCMAEHTDLHLKLGSRRPKIERPEWLHNGEVIQFELMSDESLASTCDGISCVIHLAALNEIDCAADPEQALIVNGIGSLKLLRAAERAGVERFIYFSTARVYGAPLVGKITEETRTMPVHPYAISHRVAEDCVLSSHAQGNITGIVFRLSNGFGAPIDPDVNRWMLIANDLCRQAVSSGKLVLRSSGLQKRNFITLQDVGMAVLHFLRMSKDECADGLFNLGGEASLRIIDLAEMVAKRCSAVLGFEPAIERPQTAEDEVSLPLEYDITKLKGTGFTLNGDSETEIDNTIRIAQRKFTRLL